MSKSCLILVFIKNLRKNLALNLIEIGSHKMDRYEKK